MPAREKIAYLVDSTQKRLLRRGRSCPSCGAPESALVARKYMVTELRRCRACQLLYRTPTTDSRDTAAFYQERYSQGFTTTLPSDAELAALTGRSFAGTEKDYASYVAVLQAAGARPGATVLDFGCSWGYGSWQLTRAGYQVTSFEISRPRCTFARDKLGIDAHSDVADLKGPFDVFFSAHVLEHVPAVSSALSLARRVLRPGGLFVAFTPNGSQSLRDKDPHGWMQLWGMVHPNFLDPIFYRAAFARERRLLASSPYDLEAIAGWAGKSESLELDLGGDELLLVARAAPAGDA